MSDAPSERPAGMHRAMVIGSTLGLGAELRGPLAACGIRVVAESLDVASTPALAAARRPDLLVIETDPAAAPVELVRLREIVPEAAVIALVQTPAVGHARALLRAGADAVLVAGTTPDRLAAAVEVLRRGRRYLDPELGAELALGRPAVGPCEGLTTRQAEIVRLLALGYTNTEIAHLLFLSVRTVEAHRARIHERLGLASRAGLVRFALRNGLLDEDVLPDAYGEAITTRR